MKLLFAKESPQVMQCKAFEALSCSNNNIPHRPVIRRVGSIEGDICIKPPSGYVFKSNIFVLLLLIGI
jgi:hypothetical protein